MNTFDDKSVTDAFADRQLWCNVIQQALTDATAYAPGSILFREVQADQARHWLTVKNPDFHLVCDLAGFEPERVRSFAKQMINQAIANPPKPRWSRGRQPKQAEGGVVENFTDSQGTGGGQQREIDSNQTFLKPEKSPCP